MTDTADLVERLRELVAKATLTLANGEVKVVTLARMLRNGAYAESPRPDGIETTDFEADATLIVEAVNALPTLLESLSSSVAEVEALRAALEPFVQLADARDARYRKRGGKPESFPDTHPSYDIAAGELKVGVWRAARAALAQPVRGD